MTTPTGPIGHAALMGLAVNVTTMVLPELPTTRSVFVIMTEPPLALVVGLFAQLAPRMRARNPSAKASENKRELREI